MSRLPNPIPDPSRVPMSSDERFLRYKKELHQQLIGGMDLSTIGSMSEDELRIEVRRAAEELCRLSPEMFSLADRERLVNEVMDETFGLGPLETLMRDPTITDILINGPKTVYIERMGRLERTEVAFVDDRHLVQIVQRIVGRIGRRVDETRPMVDARLADGSRVNAVISPLALDGALVSIRRFGARPLLVRDLMEKKSIPKEMVTFLAASVKARVNMLISGGTGSGKTTLLNALSAFIPHEERVVTIEDAAELRLQQPHVARMETRPPNIEGVGEVTTRDLVRNALRMRPDRIIVGECRGPEALDMLQAMSTGHEGSMTTVHANDTRDALSRLEMMVMMTGFELPIPVIRQYIASSIGLIVQITRLRGGRRRITRVTEIVELRRRSYVLRDLYGYRQLGVQNGQTVGEFYASGYEPTFLGRLKSQGLELPASLFQDRVLHTENS